MAAPPVSHLPARHPPPAPPADRARHARRGHRPRNRHAPLDPAGETRARPPHPRHPRRPGLPPRPVTPPRSSPPHRKRDAKSDTRLGRVNGVFASPSAAAPDLPLTRPSDSTSSDWALDGSSSAIAQREGGSHVRAHPLRSGGADGTQNWAIGAPPTVTNRITARARSRRSGAPRSRRGRAVRGDRQPFRAGAGWVAGRGAAARIWASGEPGSLAPAAQRSWPGPVTRW